MQRICIFIFMLALLAAGCSSNRTPVTIESVDKPLISGLTTNEDGSFSAIGLMGAYELNIDATTLTADLITKRLPSLGESWLVNGGAFFTMNPCGDCLRISAINMDVNKNLVLQYTVRHPFPAGNPSEPPSAVNRLDLDLFDLALVIVPLDAVTTEYPLTGTKVYTGGYMQNASGFTTELAAITGDPAAVPYLLVIDDSIGTETTYNRFAMGSEATFTEVIKLGACVWTHYTYDMYLTFGYGSSAASRSERLNPIYFNPEFNRKGAWRVSVTPPNPPTIGKTWQDNDPLTPYTVTVKVWDWQQGATVQNPLVDPDKIAKPSDVIAVSVEIPHMNYTAQTVTMPESGTGTPLDPLVYKIPIANQNKIPAGKYRSLVKVMDSRVPEGTPTNIDYLINSPNGIDIEKYGLHDFSTYHCFQATVVAGGPISGKVNSPACPVTDQSNGALVNFNVSASSTAGPPIALFECDFDYDGVAFTPDFSQTNGIFNNVGPFTVPQGEYIPKAFVVAFRATDSSVPPNVTIFAQCEVVVTTGEEQ